MKPSPSKPAPLAAREALARKVLLKRMATRSELSSDTGLCAASVTNHTRWLLRHGFLTSTPIRVPDVKRSVEQLRVNGDQGTALAIYVRRELVESQVLGLDAEVLAQFAAGVAEPTQHGVMAAVSHATEQAKQWAADRRLSIDLAGMSVGGTVASEDGIIFGIDGVPQWRPCQPKLMLPALEDVPALHVWTQVMSKMVALSTSRRRDDNIGYVEFRGRSFHIALMRQGQVVLGQHGSTSARLHVSVSDDGPVCYCGRRGCLADLLESGRPLDVRVLADAFIHFLHRIRAEAIGLEWQGDREWLERHLADSGFTVYPIDDGHDLALRGLHMLTAEASLVRKLAHHETRSTKGSFQKETSNA